MESDGNTTGTFAVENEVQYRPTGIIAAQQVQVHDAAGNAGMLMCDMSRSPNVQHTDAPRRVIAVHGARRDARRYLSCAIGAAGAAISSSFIVAPQFLAAPDLLHLADVPPRALYWNVEGWKGGYAADDPEPVSSFAAMDSLLLQLAEGARTVVIFGNSAGGQFVNRYAAVSRTPDALAQAGIQVRFVISNPSTYLYFSEDRPAPHPGQDVNRWRYGFGGRPPSYVDSTPREALERYASRDVTVLLGADDCDNGGRLLEVSPAAMAQGANRLERGRNYHHHVQSLTSRTVRFPIELPGVGHDVADVLAAPETRRIMFGASA